MAECSKSPRIARFFKVSRERFMADFIECFPTKAHRAAELYEALKLPARATSGSAGYDFYMPVTVELAPGETVKLPTGMRVEMERGYVLLLFPRSGLGFQYRLQLNNTVGVIDGDYFFSDNEGHIFAKLTNDSREGKSVTLTEGTAFMQGIFIPYGVTAEDDVQEIRNGGFGSTTK